MTSIVSGKAFGGRIVRAAVTTMLSPCVADSSSGAVSCAKTGEESALESSAATIHLRFIRGSYFGAAANASDYQMQEKKLDLSP
jgi:hypothetical protein